MLFQNDERTCSQASFSYPTCRHLLVSSWIGKGEERGLEKGVACPDSDIAIYHQDCVRLTFQAVSNAKIATPSSCIFEISC